MTGFGFVPIKSCVSWLQFPMALVGRKMAGEKCRARMFYRSSFSQRVDSGGPVRSSKCAKPVTDRRSTRSHILRPLPAREFGERGFRRAAENGLPAACAARKLSSLSKRMADPQIALRTLARGFVPDHAQLWSAATCRRFLRLADSSAKQRRVERREDRPEPTARLKIVPVTSRRRQVACRKR